MGRALVSLGLWLLAAAGALATLFFVAMLLSPGYGDAVIAVFAAVCAGVALAAVVGLRRLGRERRGREQALVEQVLRGRLLEQVAPSRRRWRLTSSAGAFLLVLSAVPLVGGSRGALLLVVPFGLLLAASVVQLVPGASWLRVTTAGLVTRHVGRQRAHRWQDVDGFRVHEVSNQYTRLRLVGWSVLGEARTHRRAARWLRWPSGLDDGLPTEYEGDPEELAARLQRHRDAYAGTGSGSDAGRPAG